MHAQAGKQPGRPVHPIWPDLNDSPTCCDSGLAEMNSIQCTVVFKKRAREREKKQSSGINTYSGENVSVQNINVAVEVED